MSDNQDVVFMKCRANMSRKPCAGMQAQVVRIEGGVRTYRCVTCGHVWTIGVGGGVNF